MTHPALTEEELIRQHRLRTRQDDCRMGGISVEERKPSRFAAQGAEAVQSSDYRCLDHIFAHHLPLTEQDTLLDVGCVEGRVLTYLHLQGCRAKLTGIELDPEVAETARRRGQGQRQGQCHCQCLPHDTFHSVPP
mgnify:CR=1 FL=1